MLLDLTKLQMEYDYDSWQNVLWQHADEHCLSLPEVLQFQSYYSPPGSSYESEYEFHPKR